MYEMLFQNANSGECLFNRIGTVAVLVYMNGVPVTRLSVLDTFVAWGMVRSFSFLLISLYRVSVSRDV